MSGKEPPPSPSAAEPRPGVTGPVPADGGGVAVDHDAKAMPVDAAMAAPSRGRGFLRRRGLVFGTLGVLALAAALWFGVPWVRFALSTVSTDDAFVNGHATFVAPRVHGQVFRVLVDDNNRVQKGELLVQLDKEPFQAAVAVKKAAVDTAQADLEAARATVRGIEAQAVSRRWQLQQAIENVENQIALLHARVAALKKAKATLTLAQQEFDRTSQLVVSAAASRELYDQRQASLSIARAGAVQALADVNQIRVSLGLQEQPEDSADLDQVPPDLDQTFSSVLQAQAELIQTAAELGVLHSYSEAPKQMVEEFEKIDPKGGIDRTFARLAAEAPAVKQAEAKLEAAKRDLALAELDLRYTDIVAEIDGVVTRRNVNPGNDVQVGQSLMAIRSLTEIWVDANFKETQLRDLRIGQAVDLYVDMYGGRQVFNGRIAGFSIGTGSTLALLPPQNATGNFVKIVQRLPVRIELEGYDPDRKPLFLGTSVVPYVYLDKPPVGPDAGKFLQGYMQRSPPIGSATSPSGVDK
jgi:membrane fusion protein (multidrug efflux system)